MISKDALDIICEGLAEGRPLADVVNSDPIALPSLREVYKARRSDEGVAAAIDAAMRDGAEARVQRHTEWIATLTKMVAAGDVDKDKVAAIKLAMDGLRWEIERSNPARWGARATVQHEGNVTHTVAGILAQVDGSGMGMKLVGDGRADDE